MSQYFSFQKLARYIRNKKKKILSIRSLSRSHLIFWYFLSISQRFEFSKGSLHLFSRRKFRKLCTSKFLQAKRLNREKEPSSDAVAKATSSILDSRPGNFKKSSLVDKSRKAGVHYRKVYYRREHISRLLKETHVLSACDIRIQSASKQKNERKNSFTETRT